MEKPALIEILKIKGVQNQVPIKIGTALVCNHTLKIRNYNL